MPLRGRSAVWAAVTRRVDFCGHGQEDDWGDSAEAASSSTGGGTITMNLKAQVLYVLLFQACSAPKFLFATLPEGRTSTVVLAPTLPVIGHDWPSRGKLAKGWDRTVCGSVVD
jgi:hypothetical protein